MIPADRGCPTLPAAHLRFQARRPMDGLPQRDRPASSRAAGDAARAVGLRCREAGPCRPSPMVLPRVSVTVNSQQPSSMRLSDALAMVEDERTPPDVRRAREMAEAAE